MLTVGLLAQLTAKQGREDDVADLLRSARELAAAEEQTVVWFAVRIDQTRFAIFDAFRDDAGRDAHLRGAIAAALTSQADTLLAEPPTISKVDLLAYVQD
jgi:quinol monooxygenase YgiN